MNKIETDIDIGEGFPILRYSDKAVSVDRKNNYHFYMIDGCDTHLLAIQSSVNGEQLKFKSLILAGDGRGCVWASENFMDCHKESLKEAILQADQYDTIDERRPTMPNKTLKILTAKNPVIDGDNLHLVWEIYDGEEKTNNILTACDDDHALCLSLDGDEERLSERNLEASVKEQPRGDVVWADCPHLNVKDLFTALGLVLKSRGIELVMEDNHIEDFTTFLDTGKMPDYYILRGSKSGVSETIDYLRGARRDEDNSSSNIEFFLENNPELRKAA